MTVELGLFEELTLLWRTELEVGNQQIPMRAHNRDGCAKVRGDQSVSKGVGLSPEFSDSSNSQFGVLR